jgi:hypothetical protein
MKEWKSLLIVRIVHNVFIGLTLQVEVGESKSRKISSIIRSLKIFSTFSDNRYSTYWGLGILDLGG